MMNSDQTISPTVNVGNREKLDSTQKKKLEKAVREFESIFVGYMLKGMRSTIEKADNSNDSFGGEILEGMFDSELASHLSKSSNIGIADVLYRKMTGEGLASADSGEDTEERIKRIVSMLRPVVNEKAVNAAARNSGVLAAGKTLDDRLQNYSSFIDEASKKFGVSDSLIKAVIAAESAARPQVQSVKNAKGLMQLIDSTANEMGVEDVWNPRENILGGTKYLKQLLEQFDGDEKLAIASYNAGPSAVQKHGGIPPYKETRQYVSRVLNYVKKFETTGE